MARAAIISGILGLIAGAGLVSLTALGGFGVHLRGTAGTCDARPGPAPVAHTGPIQPGDLLMLYIRDLEANGSISRIIVRIDEVGNARLPAVPKRVKLGGLTMSDAEDAADKAYADQRVMSSSAVQSYRVASGGGNFDPEMLIPSPSSAAQAAK